MSYHTKVTPELVALIEHGLVHDGLTIQKVAKRVGVSTATVSNVRKAGFNIVAYRNMYLKRKLNTHLASESYEEKHTWLQRIFRRLFNVK